MTALSDHAAGVGLCGAGGMSRPISSNRCRMNRAPQDEDAPSHAAPPTPAAAPVIMNLRRVRMEGFTLVNTSVQSDGKRNLRSIGS